MHKLTTFFLYVFLMDGLFSVVDALSRLHISNADANPLGVLFSLSVLLLGLFLFAGTVITPRLPKRQILPPVLFMGMCIIWSILYGDRGELLISIAQIFLASGLIVGFKNEDGQGLQNYAASRPFFTWRNFLLTGLLNGAIALCMAVFIGLGIGQKVRSGIEESTGRYLTIQPAGISLEERRFKRGDKEIRLIGMMHIAKSGFYDDVAGSLPPDASTVVLLEGVGDRNHLLKKKLDYGRIAQVFGFASQKESSFSKKAIVGLKETEEDKEKGVKPPKLEYQVADLDLSDFKPETVDFIRAAQTLMDSADMHEAMQKYPDLKPTLEKGSETVGADILDKRNAHLLGEIQTALETHTTIVVPWGARHMPDLEAKIKEWGFAETTHSSHQAVFFKNKALIALISLLDRLPADEKQADSASK